MTNAKTLLSLIWGIAKIVKAKQDLSQILSVNVPRSVEIHLSWKTKSVMMEIIEILTDALACAKSNLGMIVQEGNAFLLFYRKLIQFLSRQIILFFYSNFLKLYMLRRV